MAVDFNRVSSSDVNKIKDMHNPLQYDTGDFSNSMNDLSSANSGNNGNNSTGSQSMDGLFDSLDDLFADDSSIGNDLFGDSSKGQNVQNQGQIQNGFEQYGFNNSIPYNSNVTPHKDSFDKAMEYSGVALKSTADVILEMIKSIPNRTADDFGYYCTNLIKTGIVGIIIGVILMTVGLVCNISFIGVNGMAKHFMLGFGFITSLGMIGIAAAASKIMRESNGASHSISDMPDVKSTVDDDCTDEYENKDIDFDEFFENLDMDTEIKDNKQSNSIYDNEIHDENCAVPNFSNIEIEDKHADTDELVKNIKENKVVNRKELLNTFIPFLELSTPEFSDRKELDKESNEFYQIETICLKALSNMLKCDMGDVDSELEDVYETYFSYEIRLKRVRGLNRLNDLAFELGAYFKDSKTHQSVDITTDIDGDDYKIVVPKGVTAKITLGDVFKLNYVFDFFADENNRLPIIAGIDELGNAILEDAKYFDSMLIVGKPRSGKSWYVLSILLTLCIFNLPEDVQFIIVDPKESVLFKEMALLPHVAGLFNDKDIIKIMDDIICNESVRRKKLIDDCHVNDIWELHKKGVKLPVLYLAIDEYLSVRNNLGSDMAKIFDEKLQIIISQYPSLGIRVILMPHRSTSVVDKTNRTMISYAAAVRADNEEVNATLCIKGWKKPLNNIGDIAIRCSSYGDGKYVRGMSVMTENEENEKLIRAVAESFYKMGVDLPDMSSLKFAYNRDEEKIRDILCNKNRIQYDANYINND